MSEIPTKRMDNETVEAFAHITARFTPRPDDPPLPVRINALLDLACAHRPDFRRSIPSRPTDSDELICSVLRDLLGELAELRETRGGA
jgi:hypothetical protein